MIMIINDINFFINHNNLKIELDCVNKCYSIIILIYSFLISLIMPFERFYSR